MCVNLVNGHLWANIAMPLVSLLCFQVKSIVQQLLVNLDTPSQEVQESISNCLHPLMPAVREEAADIVASLLNKVSCGSGHQVT